MIMLDLTVMSTPTLLGDWRAIIDHRVSHTEGSWMIRNIISYTLCDDCFHRWL